MATERSGIRRTPMILHLEGDVLTLTVDGVEVLSRGQGQAPVRPCGSFFDDTPELDTLAALQGVFPVTRFEDLIGEFWPEGESADDFIAAVRQWRREGTGA